MNKNSNELINSKLHAQGILQLAAVSLSKIRRQIPQLMNAFN